MAQARRDGLYESFFGLQREPFSIAPDPSFLFPSERHREALAHLVYGLGGGGGFVVLTGAIGGLMCTVQQLHVQCLTSPFLQGFVSIITRSCALVELSQVLTVCWT